jgi:hypothetical protein
MATLEKIPVVWNGLTGLPGVGVFYGATGGGLAGDLKTFFTALVAIFPTGLSWQVPVAGDTIDDASGHITGGWTDAGGGTVSASGGSTTYAAGTGVGVRWLTDGIVNSRRLKGRSFLTGIGSGLYQNDGTIGTATVTTIQTAADALVAGGAMQIWHRPEPGTFTGGLSSLVTAALVEDRVVSLRSRRT